VEGTGVTPADSIAINKVGDRCWIPGTARPVSLANLARLGQLFQGVVSRMILRTPTTLTVAPSPVRASD